MKENELNANNKLVNSVCNFEYLNEMMGHKKNLVKEIIEAFILQVPEEIEMLDSAVGKSDFATIKKLSHTIKSSVSIMGVNTAIPILQEMENLGTATSNIDRINELNIGLKLICKQVIEEINLEKSKYEIICKSTKKLDVKSITINTT